MPKTIATTPSWYWPEGVPRVLGIPPYFLEELLVERWTAHPPPHPMVVSSDASVGALELAERVRDGAGAIEAMAAERPLVVSAGPTAQGAVLVLAALASGRPVLLVPPGGAVAAGDQPAGASLGMGDAAGSAALQAAGFDVVDLDAAGARASREASAAERTGTGAPGHPGSDPLADLRAPVACMTGKFGPAWHSHRSLLAGATALAGFLGATGDATWLSTVSPCAWDGFLAMSVALLAGATLVLAEPGDAALEATAAEEPTWVMAALPDAVATWGGSRRRRAPAKGPRGALLTVDGPFDPDARASIAPAAGAAALTLFGMAETGPILASHPSWYLDEAVGIPVPNMHVVPADPDTGEPISALWELVDQAMVTAWSPSLALADGGGDGGGRERFVGRRFVTGVLAASDPNGMLYLVDT